MSEFTCSECGCEWDYCDDPGGFSCPDCDVDIRYGVDYMSRLDELYGISGDDEDDDDEDAARMREDAADMSYYTDGCYE
jgi:hypothetical protein